MTERFTHVSSGSPDFADADDPSPESDPRKTRLEGVAAGPQTDSPDRGSPGQGETGTLRILFLDDDPDRARAFLHRTPEAVWVQTAEDCIARLEDVWDQVHLDHDLGREVFVDSSRPDCGMEVVRWLCNESCARFEKTLFIIHTYNAEAGETMVRSLRENQYQAVYRPFGVDLVEWLSGDEPEETGEKVPVRPAKPAWSEWIRRLSRKLRPGTPARDRGPAAEDSSSSGSMPEDTSSDAPQRE